jgi:hypothetical protein
MSYRSKTYTGNDVILVKRSMILLIKVLETAYTHFPVAGITRLIFHLAIGWTVWVSYPNRNKRFSFLQNYPIWLWLWVPPSFLFVGYQVPSPMGQADGAWWLISHCHPAPRMRMSGVVPLLPLYAFKACSWTTVPISLL